MPTLLMSLDPMTFEAFTAADEEVIWQCRTLLRIKIMTAINMLSYNPEGLAIELNMSNNVAYLDNILSYEANEPFFMTCDKSGCLDPMTFEAFTAADEEVIWQCRTLLRIKIMTHGT
jgi:hypothetical protein